VSVTTGTTIRCDRHDCTRTAFGANADSAAKHAAAAGWTHTDDGRDFCGSCTSIRAARKSVHDLVPEPVRLFEVFDAAEAVGWERRDGEEEGVAHFFCCGEEVAVDSVIGYPYHARCKVCGKAIADAIGPSFGNAWMSMPDPDLVDTEDPATWVIVAEYEEHATTPEAQP
jgi:hypothetical protein